MTALVLEDDADWDIEVRKQLSLVPRTSAPSPTQLRVASFSHMAAHGTCFGLAIVEMMCRRPG